MHFLTHFNVLHFRYKRAKQQCAFYSAIERLSLPISHVFKMAENSESDTVGCCGFCGFEVSLKIY